MACAEYPEAALICTVMSAAGYVSGSAVQTATAVWGIRFLIGVTPIIACLVIVFCMYKYPLGRPKPAVIPAPAPAAD